MKRRISVTVGVVLGLLAGVAARHLTASSSMAKQTLGQASAKVSATGGKLGREDSRPSHPRPTLDDVLAAGGFQQQVLIGRYLKEATIDEVLGLLERSFNGKFRKKIWPVMTAINHRGLELDPEAVVALIAERDPRGYQLEGVFGEWAMIDSERAIAESAGRSKRIRQAVLLVLIESDPERALTFMEEEGVGDQYLRSRIASKQIEEPLGTDPQTALDQVMNLTNKRERGAAMSSLAAAWVKKDPVATLAWLQGDEDIPNRARLLEQVLPQLVESHSEKVRAVLASLPLNPAKGRLEGRVLKRLAKKDFESALKQVKSYPPGSYRDYLFGEIVSRSNPPDNLLSLIDELGIDADGNRRLTSMRIQMENGGSSSSSGSNNVREAVKIALTRVAQDSPEEALSQAYNVFGNDQEGEFRQLAQTLLKQWAAKDPVEAANWALELPEGQMAGMMKAATVGNWVRSDPATAAAALSERDALSDAQIRKEVSKAWSKRDPASLLSWAESLPTEARNDMLMDAVREVAKHAPEMAIEHLGEIDSLEQRQSLVQHIGRTWGDRAPQEALPWLQEQPEEFDVGSPVRTAAKAWVLESPLEASEWIGSLEQSPRRDHAVAGMVHALVSSNNAQRDFESAKVWVETIADPTLKSAWTEEIQTRQAKETPAAEPPQDGFINVGRIGIR